MSFEKLDKRLTEDIRIRRENMLATGKTPDEIAQESFYVTIELKQTPSIPIGVPRQQAFRKIEQQVRQAQADIVDRLRSMGVTRFKRQILSNSIAATLTLSQIQEIAKRDDVNLIRLVKVDKVAIST